MVNCIASLNSVALLKILFFSLRFLSFFPCSFSLSFPCFSSHPSLTCTTFIPHQLEASHHIPGTSFLPYSMRRRNLPLQSRRNLLPYLPFPQAGWCFDLVSVGDSWWENLQRRKEIPCQHVRHPRRIWEQEGRSPLALEGEQGSLSGGHRAWVRLARTSLGDLPWASASVWSFAHLQVVKGWSTGPVCRWTTVRNLVSKTWDDCSSSSTPLCVQQTWEVHWNQAKALAEWGYHILTIFCMRKMEQWK